MKKHLVIQVNTKSQNVIVTLYDIIIKVIFFFLNLIPFENKIV